MSDIERLRKELADALLNAAWLQPRGDAKAALDAISEVLRINNIPTTPTVQPNEWISCDERLPDMGVDVLCYFGDHVAMCVGTYSGRGIWQDSNGSMDEFDMNPISWKAIAAPNQKGDV